MRLAIGSCLAAFLFAAPVHAQDGSCQSWKAAGAAGTAPGQPGFADRIGQMSFVFDYIAVHTREPERDYYAGQINLTEGVDAGEIESWVNDYCMVHPGDDLAQAAAALMDDLTKRWLKSHPN